MGTAEAVTRTAIWVNLRVCLTNLYHQGLFVSSSKLSFEPPPPPSSLSARCFKRQHGGWLLPAYTCTGGQHLTQSCCTNEASRTQAFCDFMFQTAIALGQPVAVHASHI
ncbi:hypothetical protein ABBQ38_003628 [Trebouxia sp. C0009 RCD-2024]